MRMVYINSNLNNDCIPIWLSGHVGDYKRALTFYSRKLVNNYYNFKVCGGQISSQRGMGQGTAVSIINIAVLLDFLCHVHIFLIQIKIV